MPSITNRHEACHGPGARGFNTLRLMLQQHAHLLHQYFECSDAVQAVIQNMARIIDDPNTDADDREAALDTLTEAFYPTMTDDLAGIELDAIKCYPRDGTDVESIKARMADEEATFADRLAKLLDDRGITQLQLAEMTGVGQSAISMMLARNCRPQRRTIEKLATALKVKPEDLWPKI